MDWFTTQCDQLRAMFRGFFPAPVTRSLMSLTRPALRLGAGPPDARCRLGGRPVLPAGVAWPAWGGRALEFVGVIDFAELGRAFWLPDLPGAGTAAFYYATEMPRPWGDDPAQRDGWRVLPDADTPAGPATRRAVRLGAAPFLSLPSPHEPVLGPVGAGVAGFDEIYPQLYASWARFVWKDQPRHQSGGWPVVVQRTLWRDCALAAAGLPSDATGATTTDGEPAGAETAAHGWRLLLQLDSDERLGWLWGDTGFVYFSARAADVRAGALDRSWLILQATP
ncbi:MAG TPA: YwqG family protein [Streptosporangiaceae bacterium]